MTRYYLIVCGLCHTDGDEVPATHSYYTNDGEKYDVCEKHAKTVKEAGLTLTELSDEEKVMET